MDLLLYTLFLFIIFGCVESSLLCAGFLLWRRAGTALDCNVGASHWGAQALGARATAVAAEVSV